MRINRFIHNSFGSKVLQLSMSLLVILGLSDLGFAKMDEEPKSFSLPHTFLEQVERKVLPKVDVGDCWRKTARSIKVRNARDHCASLLPWR